MSEFTYRHEINLCEIADEYAKRLEEQVDEMVLDRAADTLERFGYVKVVRCRDCRFSHIFDGKGYPGKKYEGMTYCIAWSDGYQGEWVKPDGYCHRAKRKEGGDD